MAKFTEMPDFDDYLALYEKGDYREAYAVLRDIMERQPCWSKVGDLYVECADLELLLNDDVCRARELLDKARELGCHLVADYYSTSGYVLWRAGERDKGIQDIEKSVALDPSIRNLKTLGTVLSSDGDKRAITVWQRVLEQDPNNCSAHIHLGILAAKSGDRGKGLLMAKRAEKLVPTRLDICEIARLYHELEEFPSAIKAYLDADKLGHEPKGELYAAIAGCYFLLGDNRLGRKYAEWAMRFNPESDYVQEVWRESAELRREEH